MSVAVGVLLNIAHERFGGMDSKVLEQEQIRQSYPREILMNSNVKLALPQVDWQTMESTEA